MEESLSTELDEGILRKRTIDLWMPWSSRIWARRSGATTRLECEASAAASTRQAGGRPVHQVSNIGVPASSMSSIRLLTSMAAPHLVCGAGLMAIPDPSTHELEREWMAAAQCFDALRGLGDESDRSMSAICTNRRVSPVRRAQLESMERGKIATNTASWFGRRRSVVNTTESTGELFEQAREPWQQGARSLATARSNTTGNASKRNTIRSSSWMRSTASGSQRPRKRFRLQGPSSGSVISACNQVGHVADHIVGDQTGPAKRCGRYTALLPRRADARALQKRGATDARSTGEERDWGSPLGVFGSAQPALPCDRQRHLYSRRAGLPAHGLTDANIDKISSSRGDQRGVCTGVCDSRALRHRTTRRDG